MLGAQMAQSTEEAQTFGFIFLEILPHVEYIHWGLWFNTTPFSALHLFQYSLVTDIFLNDKYPSI